MNMSNKQFSDNFQINLFLAEMLKSYNQNYENCKLGDVDWRNVTPELKNKINEMIQSMCRASVISDEEMRILEKL